MRLASASVRSPRAPPRYSGSSLDAFAGVSCHDFGCRSLGLQVRYARGGLVGRHGLASGCGLERGLFPPKECPVGARDGPVQRVALAMGVEVRRDKSAYLVPRILGRPSVCSHRHKDMNGEGPPVPEWDPREAPQLILCLSDLL